MEKKIGNLVQYFLMDGNPAPIGDTSKGYLMVQLRTDGSALLKLSDGDTSLEVKTTVAALRPMKLEMFNEFDLFKAEGKKHDRQF